MKKGILLILFMLLAVTIRVEAATYSNYLPGGKNYINPENFRLRNETIESIESFKVLPNQTYTLTYPGDDMFFDSYVTVGGASGTTYLDGSAMALSKCDVDQYLAICTFTTSSSESALYVRIKSTGTTQYYQYYQTGNIQLEEGSVSTSYADYVAPQLDLEEPSFTESGAFILSYKDQTPISQIIDNHISVHDEIDGDLTDQIVIESDTYTSNIGKVGSYLVALSATDSSGNKATFDLTILVKDELAPIISGPSSITVEVDDGYLVDDLINTNFSISDEYDGSLSYQITSDTYSANKAIIGVYSVNLKATDSSLNETTKTFTIEVVDTKKPTISGPVSLVSPMSNPLTIEEILQTQVVDDNYTSLALTDLQVTDGFTTNEQTKGIYEINLQVSDSSGNQAVKIITVEVQDDIKPAISGPVTYVDSYSKEITIEDLRQLLSISDNNDVLSMADVLVVEDTLSGRVTDVGTFSVTFEVQDYSGNTSTHQISITLVDDIAPVIYVDSYIINLHSGTSFTNQDAYRLLISSEEIQPGNYEMETLVNEYLGHEDTPGSYLYKVAFKADTGEVLEKEFIIKVEDTLQNSEGYVTLRNVLVYSLTIILVGVTVYKVKK